MTDLAELWMGRAELTSEALLARIEALEARVRDLEESAARERCGEVVGEIVDGDVREPITCQKEAGHVDHVGYREDWRP